MKTQEVPPVSENLRWPALASEPLCVADFHVEGAIMNLGRSPFSERRVGYITGGEFRGARLSGEILPGGGNWSQAGDLGDGAACSLFDARALWRSDDGAMIHVSYAGRSVIPAHVLAQFRNPDADPVPPSEYYLRVAPVFETADPRYDWLNGILTVGRGERMPWGVRHWIFAIR
jgi:hypothetical protein